MRDHINHDRIMEHEADRSLTREPEGFDELQRQRTHEQAAYSKMLRDPAYGRIMAGLHPVVGCGYDDEGQTLDPEMAETDEEYRSIVERIAEQEERRREDREDFNQFQGE